MIILTRPPQRGHRTEWKSAAMKALMSGRTQLRHCPTASTIRDADAILFMEHGNIIEQGKFTGAIAKNGALRALLANSR